MDRRPTLVVLFAVLVVLAGCGGSAGGADAGAGGGASESMAVEEDAPRAADTNGGGGDGGSADTVAGRSIIRTGEVRLRVDSYEDSAAALETVAEARGGYVSDSVRQVHDADGNEWTSGRVVLRVPQANFSATMRAVEAEGEVLESQIQTQDVTDQVVDLEARLTNLRAERERLRTLYAQANDTEDVLAVERRLSEVQTEIEQTEARLQSLERRVAYSTITVELSEPRPEGPAPDAWYDTPVVAAFLESVEGVGVLLRALVVGFAYAAPYLLILFTPLAVLGALLYRFRHRLP
jgi:hypothetical protein